MGKAKLKRTKQEIEKGENVMKQLGLSESDRQHIYDVIEMDLESYE